MLPLLPHLLPAPMSIALTPDNKEPNNLVFLNRKLHLSSPVPSSRQWTTRQEPCTEVIVQALLWSYDFKHHKALLYSYTNLTLVNKVCIHKFQIMKNLEFNFYSTSCSSFHSIFCVCEHEYALHKLFYLRIEQWKAATSLSMSSSIVSFIKGEDNSTYVIKTSAWNDIF